MESKPGIRGWKKRLQAVLPSGQNIQKNKWVAWIGPSLHHPRLWHFNRKGVAMGAAIGIFFAFLIPLMQIPFAAIFAVWFKGHLVTAVVTTLVTNPLTFGPIYLLANEIGGFILESIKPDMQEAISSGAYEAGDAILGWFDTFMLVGKNIIVGLLVLAIFGAMAGYLLVLGVWRMVITIEWYKRRKHRSSR
ncbi:MAG: DUF2062 domain-containing protein [Proteobacteria bacterium]|nr:DUF2062 domain-containing protein [Pseudomonadota bacterium]MDA1331000.1 DUF2062 domain-containing protein [Pseudomonadota bacterium]